MKNKIEFKKNDLYDKILDRYYTSFRKTLDTEDYVPPKFNDYIIKRYFKNMKKDFKKVDKMYKVPFIQKIKNLLKNKTSKDKGAKK